MNALQRKDVSRSVYSGSQRSTTGVTKACVMCYPGCGMVNMEEALLLIGKSGLCGGSRFPLLLSEYVFILSDARSSQCSTTGATKAVVCVILAVGWCI